MTEQTVAKPRPNPEFERKVRLSRWALLFERLWPRVWGPIAVIGFFVLVSLAGVWPHLDAVSHKIAMTVFAAAMLGSLVLVALVKRPTREEAVRRIERRSNVPHRPASTYEDTLSHPGSDPATIALWQAHRDRVAKKLAGLEVGAPEPRTDRHDPWALRALLLLGVLLLTVLVGDSASDRIAAAFRFGPPVTAAESRLDAWLTPPAYTAKPPIMLSDGARGGLLPISPDGKSLEVPERSALIVRSSGVGLGRLGLEMRADDGKVEKQEAAAPKTAADAAEIKLELRRSGTAKVTMGGSTIATWVFQVIPDQPPKIVMTKDPERSPRGSLKLTYKVEDDYGVASAEAKVEKVPSGQGDPDTAWAREDIKLKGPRLPLERPPPLPLRLPRANAKDNVAQTQLELGSHPWSGLRVIMTLVAKDHAGQIGKSTPVEMVLPARQFRKPLARAVVEQRRRLVEDTRYRSQVLVALDALTAQPAGFIRDQNAYLGLRSAYHRLERDKTRAGIKSVVDQLCHVALRIEDGNLSDAERRLRDIQDQLSKALEQGASDAEIQKLMQELRQALNEYMQQMMKQAEGQPPMQMPPGFDQNQVLSQEDLERMMRQMEDMMRNGSRDAAQQMLSQLRDMLDRLQNGRMAQGQQGGQQNQQMMQMMDELAGIVGRQQQLMDDTFGERQGQRGQRGQQGQQGEGQQPGQGQGRGELGRRQSELGDQLGRLQRQLRENGMRAPEQFGEAQEAMRQAEESLRRGDMDGATQEQSRALEQLRQGAQSMAQQMLQRMPSQFGQAGDAPRDPLGRPQRSEIPDPGTSVKVPDEIDMQRAREILEELRKRLGESTRPALELDYIERLLKRY